MTQKPSTGKLKLTRHKYYDYDIYDYTEFVPDVDIDPDHNVFVFYPSEHTINGKRFDVEI